jgi:hypothetical protein
MAFLCTEALIMQSELEIYGALYMCDENPSADETTRVLKVQSRSIKERSAAPTLRNFVLAFFMHFLTLMSGPLSVFVAVLGLWFADGFYARIVFGLLGIIALFISAYLIWKHERLRVIEFERLLDDTIEANYANVRLADSPNVLALFTGAERAKVITLLMGGSPSSWARNSLIVSHDLNPLGGDIWQSHKVNFQAKEAEDQGAINQTYLRPKLGGNATHYDICLNLLQLKRAWPDLEISQSKCDVF